MGAPPQGGARVEGARRLGPPRMLLERRQKEKGKRRLGELRREENEKRRKKDKAID